jgi:hypothetical protein
MFAMSACGSAVGENLNIGQVDITSNQSDDGSSGSSDSGTGGDDSNSNGGDGSTDGNDSTGNGGETNSYLITGMGYNNDITFQITQTISISSTLMEGECKLIDHLSRQEFKSISINSIDVSDETATITGNAAVKMLDDVDFAEGYTFELTITGGTPGDASLRILNPDSSVYYNLPSNTFNTSIFVIEIK